MFLFISAFCFVLRNSISIPYFCLSLGPSSTFKTSREPSHFFRCFRHRGRSSPLSRFWHHFWFHRVAAASFIFIFIPPPRWCRSSEQSKTSRCDLCTLRPSSKYTASISTSPLCCRQQFLNIYWALQELKSSQFQRSITFTLLPFFSAASHLFVCLT